MKEFKLTDEFKQYGYIHCNSQEEFDDMIKWFEKNSIVNNDLEYHYNSLYSTSIYETIIFDSGNFKYSNNKPLSDGFYIIEWTNYMSTDNESFTKDMLKDGMVVELKNGKLYILLNSIFITKQSGFVDTVYYNNNLIMDGCNNREDLDVIRVFKFKGLNLDNLFNKDSLELIWERKEEKPLELTMEDIESQYGCKVKIVNK